MSFTSYIAFRRISLDGDYYKLYELTEPLTWDIGRKGSDWTLTVPKGFMVDVSAPSWLEWLIDVHDMDNLAAAAVHDLLLKEGHDEAFASSEFRRALIARGRGKARAWVFFFATLVWTVLS